MKSYDIAVVGGGASGLMAAAVAGKAQKRVVVLEGNAKLGKKLLATGNGRCNLSHRGASAQNYHGDKGGLGALLAEYSAEKITEVFREMGLLTTDDGEGRIYPCNFQAAAVLAVLGENCAENGVDCLCDFHVFSALHSEKGFLLKAEDGREVRAEKLILATGGMASPKHSSGSDGYALARQFGHSVTPLYPALTQLTTADKFVAPLAGMRCRATVTLLGDGSPFAAESGELLFADKALSGICIFGLSVYAGEFFALGTLGGKGCKALSLQADLCPGMSRDALTGFLRGLAHNRGTMPAGELLGGVVNQKVGRALVKRAGVDPLLSAGKLNPAQLEDIAAAAKSLTLPINGTKGWAEAQITAGGVPLEELDPKTLESLHQRGLYLSGELLNVHGDCGGYNLHWAWLTGLAAGKSAADDRIIL